MKLQLDENKLTAQYMLHLQDKDEEYEPEVSALLKQVLKKGDVFIDCGSHVGYFTVLAGTLGCEVHAFEAEKENYEDLLVNIKLNKLKVTAYNKAVGDENKIVKLNYNFDNDGGHCLWEPGKHFLNELCKTNKGVEEVEMVTLDSFNLAPKVIKIDVEGCEMMVLKGAEETIKRTYPTIIMEINKFALREMGTDEVQIQEYLEPLGYKCFSLIYKDNQLSGGEVNLKKIKDAVINVAFIRMING